MIFLEPFGASFAGIRKKIAEEGQAEILEAKSSLELVTLLRSASGGVLLCHVPDRKTFYNLQATIKMLKSMITKGYLKVLITTAIKEGTIFSEFSKLGVPDVLLEPVPEKAFLFKVHRCITAIAQKFVKNDPQHKEKQRADQKAQASESDAPKKRPRPDSQTEQETSEDDQTIRFIDPLDGIKSDCWLMKGGSAKKIMGRWTIRLTGPSPVAGKWVRLEEGQNADRFWKWESLIKENDPFVVATEGQWIFKGHKPDFKDGRWSFVGKRPELSFQSGPIMAGAKVSAGEDGKLTIARDSKAALDKLPAIVESLEQVITLKEKEHSETPDEKSVRKKGDSNEWRDINDLRKDGEENESDWKNNLTDDEAAAEDKEYQFDEEEARAINDKRGDDPEARGIRDRRGKNSDEPIEFQELIDPRGDEPEPEQEATQEGDVASRALEFADKIRARLPQDTQGEENPALETHPIDEIKKAIEKKAEEAATSPDSEKSEKQKRKYSEQEIVDAPHALKALEPPGPSIGPMAIAYLLSELMCRMDRDRDYIAKRFCQYTSSSCGGMRIELWAKTQQGWVCSASSDGSPGNWQDLVEQSGSDPVFVGDVAVSKVKSPDQKILGAVVVGNIETLRADLGYVTAVSEAVVGLMEAFSAAA